MQSIRALARAAPRASSRIASYSTRTPLRPAFHIAIRSKPTVQIPRYFSLSTVRRDDLAQELAAKLKQEISIELEESSNSAESDSNIEAFFKEYPDWSLENTEGEQDVYLRRKYEDEDITVAFSIADFNTPLAEDESDPALLDEEEDLDALAGSSNAKNINQGHADASNIKVAPEDQIAASDRESQEEDWDSEETPAFPASINVLVQRQGKGALRVHLIAQDGDFSIESVSHLAEDKVAAAGTPAEIIRASPEAYDGPPFQQLDEEVQTLLREYLEVRGIDTNLMLFIPEYIDVKEQKEYVGWLNRIKNFVE